MAHLIKRPIVIQDLIDHATYISFDNLDAGDRVLYAAEDTFQRSCRLPAIGKLSGFTTPKLTQIRQYQFIKRLVQFAQTTGLRVRLIYYPPYHSKYNPIERCWAALANNWNGAILNTLEDALAWAANMTWRGISPVVQLVEGIYPKHVSVPKDELAEYEQHWQSSETLPKWDVLIAPS